MRDDATPSSILPSESVAGKLGVAPAAPIPDPDVLIFAALNQVGMVRDKAASKPVSPAFAVAHEEHSKSDLPDAAPDLIPNYQLLREISRGGQGIVYKAIQKTTKRQVAVKVMREGPFAGPRDRIRFEREIEVLAQLNHPNIVAILDSGVVRRDAGHMHFFAMDYISGRSLDAWLNESKRTVDEVLGVFIKICEAVNAAHLKGIIHRDLKPGNVRIDGQNEPHILDFGLAKTATGEVVDELDAQATPQMMTVTGQLLGSLPWSSPEQADGRIAMIDVRTDVYSLGVMLYQCLTGRFPYEVIGAIRDVMNNILHTSPARPSSVSRPGRARINDEVETIVLKCLSKERDRRYQNAGELARDLHNYLDGQPIEAKRDSGWYVLRKKASRHRALAASVAAIVISAIAGGTTAAVFWQRERGARIEAQGATVAAQMATEREATERRRVQSLFEFTKRVLAAPDPDLLQGANAAGALRIAEAGEKRARTHFADEPLMLADWLDNLGLVRLTLGDPDKRAKALLENALAIRTASAAPRFDVAASHVHLARASLDTSDKAVALAHAQSASNILREMPAEAAVIELLSEALAQAGVAQRQLNRPAESAATLKDALALRADHQLPPSDIDAEILTSLSVAYRALGRIDEALVALTRAEPYLVQVFGDGNSRLLVWRANTARVLLAAGGPEDLARGRKILDGLIETNRAVLAPVDVNHPRLSLNLDLLGKTLTALGELPAAQVALEEALRMRDAKGDTNERTLAGTHVALARVLRERGDLAGAARHLHDAGLLLRPASRGSLELLSLGRENVEMLLASGPPAPAAAAAQALLDASAMNAAVPTLDLAYAQTLAARAFLATKNFEAARANAEAAVAVVPPRSIDALVAAIIRDRALAALNRTPTNDTEALERLAARPGGGRLARELAR